MYMIDKKYSYENYLGEEDFVFMRCANADRAKSVKLAEKMTESGIQLFFDIQGSRDAEVPSKIAEAIDKCETAVFIMSKKACDSLEFRNNINYAIEQKKHIVCIRLDREEFSHGLDMQLANIPTVDYKEYDLLEKELIDREVITQDVKGAKPVKRNVNQGKQFLLVAVIVVAAAAFALGAKAMIQDRVNYYNSAEYLFRDADGSDYLNVSKYGEEAIQALEGKTVQELDLSGSTINTLEGIQKINIEVLDITDCNNLRRLDQLNGCINLHTVRLSQNLIKYIPNELGHIEFEIIK